MTNEQKKLKRDKRHEVLKKLTKGLKFNPELTGITTARAQVLARKFRPNFERVNGSL